jgi:hypothetical protein
MDDPQGTGRELLDEFWASQCHGTVATAWLAYVHGYTSQTGIVRNPDIKEKNSLLYFIEKFKDFETF